MARRRISHLLESASVSMGWPANFSILYLGDINVLLNKYCSNICNILKHQCSNIEQICKKCQIKSRRHSLSYQNSENIC